MNLSQIPKELLALLILVGGLVLFMLADPPRTQCDIQIDLFRKTQSDFIFSQDMKSTTRPPDFDKFYSRCQEANGPGGCYELFQHLKEFNHDLNAVPEQCQKSVASINEVTKIFNQSIGIFIQLAWGYQAPLSANLKQGWLDQSETYLYCLLKSDYIRLYGDEAWKEISRRNLNKLPGAENIKDPQLLAQLSMSSFNCK